MITLEHLYTLEDPYLAAGSGLTWHQGCFYIAGDDELGFVELKDDFKEKGTFHKVFPGTLPEEHKARKKAKPDIEALLMINNELLLLPSGSKPNRHQGALISTIDFTSRILSFERVYKSLEGIFPELNIEGAVNFDKTIRLFQRGNGKKKQNAIIDLELDSFLRDEIKDLTYQEVNLGTLENTSLSFTDAIREGEHIFFLAAAEKSESTYEDGEFAGAVIGLMAMDGSVIKKLPLEISSKPEGLCNKGTQFYLITDDDDRNSPSRIFSGSLRPLLVD